ncbi:MAG: DUF4238 domain-containing protein [Phycisphaerae bacterium]|nr:DUF4238 domain-containing protein [Phycisphaerae bacterium]
MSKPRKHHYVSQFYLRGFTSDNNKKNGLYVLDLESGNQWKSTSKDVACERDFYMLDFDGDDAIALEKWFSDVENRAAPVISQIIESGIIPDNEEYKHLIDFLGAMAVKVPGVLNMLDDFYERIIRRVMWQMTDTKEEWEVLVKKSRDDGLEIPDVSWEQIKELVAKKDNYTVTFQQNYRMGMILRLIPILLPLLAKRKWTFMRGVDDAPKIISSDRPLLLCWNDPADKGCMSPGFGLPGTNVSIALDQNSILIGVFEAALPSPRLDAMTVGVFNMWIGLQAERFIYSTEEDFVITMEDGTIGNKDQFLELLQKTRNP